MTNIVTVNSGEPRETETSCELREHSNASLVVEKSLLFTASSSQGQQEAKKQVII